MIAPNVEEQIQTHNMDKLGPVGRELPESLTQKPLVCFIQF